MRERSLYLITLSVFYLMSPIPFCLPILGRVAYVHLVAELLLHVMRLRGKLCCVLVVWPSRSSSDCGMGKLVESTVVDPRSPSLSSSDCIG